MRHFLSVILLLPIMSAQAQPNLDTTLTLNPDQQARMLCALRIEDEAVEFLDGSDQDFDTVNALYTQLSEELGLPDRWDPDFVGLQMIHQETVGAVGEDPGLYLCRLAYATDQMEEAERKARDEARQKIRWAHRCAEAMGDDNLIPSATSRAYVIMWHAGIPPKEVAIVVNRLNAYGQGIDAYSLADCKIFLPRVVRSNSSN